MKHLSKYLMTLSAALILFLFITTAASAAPALEKSQTLQQPSGETFTATQHGDEWFNYTATSSGTVVAIGADGYWYYAVPDNAGGLAASSSKYIIDTKPSNALMTADMPDLRAQKLSSMQNAPSYASTPGPDGAISIADATGTQKTLVLLVSFTDESIQYSESTWSDAFFGTSGKTVRTYFQEVSGNKFYFAPATESSGTSNNGVIKVTLSYAHPDTGGNTGTANRQLVADALIAANGYINFASYDTDSNGYLSTKELHIVTVVAGYEAAYTSYTPSVWAHRWSLWAGGAVEPPTLDGTKLCEYSYGGGYTQMGEIHQDHMATIGTVCHELGHDIGLPDLYDTNSSNGSSAGVGRHSLMGSGNWCYIYGTEESGASPSHMDPWCKMQLGFITPTVVSTTGSYSVKSLSAGYNVLKVPTADPDEYFLIENRQFAGFDIGLNSYAESGGIAIWHIDEAQIEATYTNNEVNDDENHKGVDVEEANYSQYGGSQLDDNNYNGMWFNNYYRSGVNTSFGPSTAPDSSLYSGTATGITIGVPGASSTSMTVNVTIPGSLSIKTLTANKASPQVSGTTIRWTATSEGATTPQYNFAVYKGSTVVSTRGWSTTAYFDWKPTTAGTDYKIRAYVRESGETDYVSKYSSTYTITATLAVNTITPNKASPQVAGTIIKWTATAVGATTPQYNFAVYKGTDVVYTRGWSSANYFNWTPTVAGTDYRVRAYVRETGATTYVSKYSSYYTVNAGLCIASLKSSKASPQAINTVIKWTATANYAITPQYNFAIYKGDTLVYTRGWSSVNYFNWTPRIAGTDYRIRAYVRETGETAYVSKYSGYYTVT